MAANTAPIYSRTADVQWTASAVLTANTNYDGTGSNQVDIFTADATEGSYIQKLRIKPLGTNVATVLRIFINNGSTKATAANNVLIDELTIAATTASAVAALPTYEIPLNVALKASHVLFATVGTTVASGFMIAGFGGKY